MAYATAWTAPAKNFIHEVLVWQSLVRKLRDVTSSAAMRHNINYPACSFSLWQLGELAISGP